MKNSWTVIIVLLFTILVFVSACMPSVKKAESMWTFMIYLNGDEEAMNQDYMKAFHEMIAKQVGSSDDVNIVIQFDRYEGIDDFGG